MCPSYQTASRSYSYLTLTVLLDDLLPPSHLQELDGRLTRLQSGLSEALRADSFQELLCSVPLFKNEDDYSFADAAVVD